MEQDRQEAIKLCRLLNGNRRRKLPVSYTTRETRASKKARTDGSPIVLTTGSTSLAQLSSPISSSASCSFSPSTTSPPLESASSPETLEGVQPLIEAPPFLPSVTSKQSSKPCITPHSAILGTDRQLTTRNHDSLKQGHIGQNVDGTWFYQIDLPFLIENCNLAWENHEQAWQANPQANQPAIHEAATPIDVTSSSGLKKKLRPGRNRATGTVGVSFQEARQSPDPARDTECTPEERISLKRKAATKSASNSVHKLKVSLYHESAQDGKPEPVGQPDVWAFKRQQICETLPYYNAYQSGAYTHNNIARSIMIDKEVGHRDKFDEEIVITSVGGGRLLDERTGKMVYKKDQMFSSTASAFIRAMELMSPVAVIAGQGNKISPSKLPHYYNVLDWFHVTDVWQEKVLGHDNMRVIIWKVRLEKIELSKRSWWAAQNSTVQTPVARPITERHACTLCKTESKVMFNVGPTCLNVSCPEFFNFGVEYDDNKLDYHPSFLGERSDFCGTVPDALSPPPLNDRNLDGTDAFGYERICKRGMVCQKCGCCIRRIEWRQWSCENPGCTYTYSTRQLTVPISKVLAINVDSGDRAMERKAKAPHRNLMHHQSVIGPYDVHNYDLPNESGGIAGFIRHFKSNRLINKQRDGPNDLFREIQTAHLDLRRGAAVHKNTTQEVLTNHFTQNFGAAYKYLVAQDSRGFDEAPLAVIKAAKRMIWAGEHSLMRTQESLQPFNECLVLGYFQGSKIGYHDDGERTLGPTVATLSLGASAVMNFRPKKKAHIPALDDQRPQYKGKGRGKNLTNGVEGKDKHQTDRPSVLSVTLEHGDIVIMHGREIQKLYEHEVVPDGELRFALTCRHIDLQTLPNDEERRIAAEKGSFPPGSEKYDYDGSRHIVAPGAEMDNDIDITRDIIAMYQAGEIEYSDLTEHLRTFSEFMETAAKSA